MTFPRRSSCSGTLGPGGQAGSAGAVLRPAAGGVARAFLTENTRPLPPFWRCGRTRSVLPGLRTLGAPLRTNRKRRPIRADMRRWPHGSARRPWWAKPALNSATSRLYATKPQARRWPRSRFPGCIWSGTLRNDSTERTPFAPSFRIMNDCSFRWAYFFPDWTSACFCHRVLCASQCCPRCFLSRQM